MTFEQLMKANESIKTTNIKGKQYAEVNQRIKAFRMFCPNGCIETEILSLENGVCVMKATVKDEFGSVLGTGTAYENEGSSFINNTSYIENCETSAVGRALGFLGIGVENDIASVQEVLNAEQQQIDEALITKVMVKALKEKCKNENVKEEVVLEICKVDSFEKIKNKVYYNILNNWNKVLEKCTQ